MSGDETSAGGMTWEDLQALAGFRVMAEGFGLPVFTREYVEQSLDDLWAAGRLPQPPSLWPDDGAALEGTISGELYPQAAGALLEALRPKCGALLFPLPSPVQVVAATGPAVFTVDYSSRGPVQGPQPAACLLDKDHRIGWHWNSGTWWKA